MLCHFGQDLNDQQKTFRLIFNQLQRLCNESHLTIENYLPMKEFFLPEYSSLEKILVIINVILFATSLSDENLD